MCAFSFRYPFLKEGTRKRGFAFAPKSASSLLVSGKAQNIRQGRNSRHSFPPLAARRFPPKSASSLLVNGKAQNIRQRRNSRHSFPPPAARRFPPKSASSSLVSGKAQNIRQRRNSRLPFLLSPLLQSAAGYGMMIRDKTQKPPSRKRKEVSGAGGEI